MSGGAHVEPEWAMATIAFVDIRGFTTFAERTTAREAVAYLTEFHEIAIPILSAHGGETISLLGDGMMAVFGVPGGAPDHAEQALAAGIEMLRAVGGALGDRCRIGIGVNSGLVLAGTMGAAHVREFSVIGDPVNVASRVQGATKELGEPLLITEATRVLLDAAHEELRSCGAITLRGKAKPVTVHGLAEGFVTIAGRPAPTT